MRTIADLTEDQLRSLSDLCAREKISRAAAVRGAVDFMLEDRDRKHRERTAALAATFGLWKARGVDAETYLSELRAEWDR